MSAEAIKKLLPRAAGISLFLDGDFGSELMAGIGVNPISFTRAPNRECTRIDVNASDGLAALLKRTLGLLHACDEIIPGCGPIIGVLEDREEGIIIFLPTPRKTDGD